MLHRPRLLKHLAESASRKLALLVAPAGYGKTTLLSDWYSQATSSFVWLTLDRNNNDIDQFWNYIFAAFAEQVPQLAQQLSDALLSHPNDLETQTILFNNLISESQHQIVLILDDYHTIENPLIDSTISALLAHLPANLQLVIASRSLPNLPLALLRTRGQLLELNSSELAFRFDEIDALVRGLWQIELAKSDITLLEKRSEGWITGIRLIIQILQQSSGDSRWISQMQRNASLLRQIDGSHPFFATYFYEEILSPQAPELQHFLLQSSLLDTLDPALCEALFEQPNSAQADPQSALLSLPSQLHVSYIERLLIEALRRNLFILPSKSDQSQIRHHPLFREMLRAQLERHNPEISLELHRRAARWYEAQGQSEAAVPHALASGEIERATRLIEQCARNLLIRGELRSLRRWLKELPDQASHERPSLLLIQSWIALFSGDLAKARSYQEAASSALELHDSLELDGLHFELEAIDTMLLLLLGEHALASEQAQALVQHMPNEASFAHSALLLAINLGELSRGDSKAALQLLHESLHNLRSSGSPFMTLTSLLLLADCTTKQGRLNLAKMLYQQAIELTIGVNQQPLPIAGSALIGLGDLLREQNELDAAEQALLNGVELSQDLDELVSFEGYIALTRLYQAKNDLPAARDALARARTTLLNSNIPIEQSMVAVLEAQLAFQEGRQAIAREWLKTSQVSLQTAPISVFQSKQNHTLSVILGSQMLIAEGHYEKALRLLGHHVSHSESAGLVSELVPLLASEALIHVALNDLPTAIMALERSLNLAASAGFVRSLLDLGQPLLDLLETSRELARSKSPLVARLPLDYIEQLLSLGAEPPSDAEQASQLVPDAPQLLSKREIDILRQVAAGLSTSAIADALVVAPSTIKSHIKNIFAKLEVHTRAQALARAQQLQLLE